MEAYSLGITCWGQEIWWGLASGYSDQPSRWGRGAFIESSLASLEHNLTVCFLWFRRMTLLPLLGSFSWHHLRKGGGYSNLKRAEKWTVSTCWESWGQTHTVRQYHGADPECHMNWILELEMFTLHICAMYKFLRQQLGKGLMTWLTVPGWYCCCSLVEAIVVVVKECRSWVTSSPFETTWAYTPWFRSLVMLSTCYIAFFILLYEHLLTVKPSGNFDWQERIRLTPLLADLPVITA